jgi:hypothetical protein
MKWVYFLTYMVSCPHSTSIAMPNSNRSHMSVVFIVYYSWKWFRNHEKFENITLTKKLRNFNIFQTVYHLLYSDLSFRNNYKQCACKIEKSGNPNYLYSKLLLNGKKSAKMVNMKKLCLIYSFLMPYHLHQSGKRFENAKQNSIQKWKIREIVVYHI